MKRYLVYTPDRVQYPGDDVDPPEYGADVVEVRCETKRDALMLGVAELHDHVRENRENDLPPWAGVKVKEVCNHECHDSPDDVGECPDCCQGETR